MRHTPALVLVAALLMGAAPAPVDDVVIIGAGLSGMSAAYYAKQAGLKYHVLELSPHIGGRMRSAKYPQGVAAEAGLAEFWEGNPALDIADALKVPTDRGDTSFSSFYFANKFYPFTQDTNEQFLAYLLPGNERTQYAAWDKKMQGLFQQIQKRPIPADLFKLKDVSFGDWVKQTSGMGPKGQMLVQTATEPEYATSWERISALDGIYEWHIFSGKGTGNRHIKGGNQKLAEAIANYVGRQNIEVNRQVTNVVTEGNTVKVTAMNPADYHFYQYRAKHVITTTPLFRLYEIQFTPPLSQKIREGIDTQTWGSYFTAHVLVDPAAKQYWQVKGQSILPILTGGPLGVCYEGESEHKGYELLNLLVTGDWAESFNARTGSFDAVREQLAEALDKQWPGFSKHIKQMTFVRYHPRAIAGWPVGRSRFDALSELLRQPYGRIHFAGDFTEGTHSDGAVKSAQRAIFQIAKAEGKKWTPPKPAGAHDAGVRAGHH